MKNSKNNGLTRLAVSAVMAAALAACGGGGSSYGDSSSTATTESPAPSFTTVTGVAAVGSPIGAATVELKCASGASVSATTDADGVWTASVMAADYPCVARVTGALEDTQFSKANGGLAKASSTPVTLHSLVAGPGITNITPLTELVVSIVGARSPALLFADAAPGVLSGMVTPSALADAVAKLAAALATLPGKPALPEGFNPLTSPFSAKKGDAADDFLESYAIALSAAGLTRESAMTQVMAGAPLTKAAHAFTFFTTPNMTAFGFRGGMSTNLDDRAVLFIPDPNRGTSFSQVTLDSQGGMTFGVNSLFKAAINPLGLAFGQMCASGAGSFSTEHHSQYAYVSDELVEVTDLNELRGITFDDYEDCQFTGTLAIDQEGNGIFTEHGKTSDAPDINLLAAFTAEGREESDNGVTSVTRAKAYKYTVEGEVRYVYVGVSNKKGDTSLTFNGDPTYVTMGVSQQAQLPR